MKPVTRPLVINACTTACTEGRGHRRDIAITNSLQHGSDFQGLRDEGGNRISISTASKLSASLCPIAAFRSMCTQFPFRCSILVINLMLNLHECLWAFLVWCLQRLSLPLGSAAQNAAQFPQVPWQPACFRPFLYMESQNHGIARGGKDLKGLRVQPHPVHPALTALR